MAGNLIRLLGYGEKLLHIDRWVLVLELKLLHPPEQRGLDKCELFASGTLVRLVANSLEQQANSCLVKQSPWRLYSSLYWARPQAAWKSFHFSVVSSIPTPGLGNFYGFFPTKEIWTARACRWVLSIHVEVQQVQIVPHRERVLDVLIRVIQRVPVLTPHGRVVS